MENAESRMTGAVADIEGTAILRSMERRNRALRVLDTASIMPNVLLGVGFALVGAFIAQIALHGSDVSELVRGFLIATSGAIAVLLYAHFRLQRRLDAVIEIFSMRD
jgi:hypothetical protein